MARAHLRACGVLNTAVFSALIEQRESLTKRMIALLDRCERAPEEWAAWRGLYESLKDQVVQINLYLCLAKHPEAECPCDN